MSDTKSNLTANEKPAIVFGWETSVAKDRLSIKDRMNLNNSEIRASLLGLGVLLVVFIISCWLAGNPFENTQRIASNALSENN